MSLPAAFAGHQATAMMAISPLDGFLQIFNNNPYFIGLMMLILNLGGRFISLEVTKKQEQFLQHPWVRRVLIFTVLFVATRNIWVAFWATLTFVLFLGYLFNENSAYFNNKFFFVVFKLFIGINFFNQFIEIYII